MANKLTPELREQVLARIAGGASYSETAAWLKSDHKVTVSKQAIGKLVSKHRTERAEVSKAIARDHITRTLPSDLTACDDKHAQAARLLDKAAADALTSGTVADFEKYSKAASIYLKFEELKRKTLGLDQPDESFVGGIVDLCGLALEEEEQAATDAAFADDDPSGSDGDGSP